MNRIAASIVLLGIGAMAGLFVSSGLAEQATVVRGTDTGKLTALRKERRDVLQQAAQLTEEAYRNGVGDYVAIPRINIDLLNAELELSPDRAGRVAVRERLVEQLKLIEKLVARVEAKIANRTDLLEAKAASLHAEIDLLLETADGK